MTGTDSDTGAVVAQLTSRLRAWAAASVAVGGALALHPSTRGLGRQTAAWGAVDGAIALLGRRRPAPPPQRLRRVLLVNAALDVGYVAGGLAVVRSERARRRGWQGDGAAVVVQGLFLLWLDLSTAAQLAPDRAVGGPS